MTQMGESASLLLFYNFIYRMIIQHYMLFVKGFLKNFFLQLLAVILYKVMVEYYSSFKGFHVDIFIYRMG